MNYTTALFLINRHARAISVTYESDINAKRETVKTLDPNIALDDFVVVQSNTRHMMTVCKVVEVDVDFDLDSTAPMNWIVSKIDMQAYQATLGAEAQAISEIKKAELRQKRESLRDNLLKNHLETIKALPIAAMNGDAEHTEHKE